jgi:MarR family transcriptional regulator, temperature-dependent positive regulator of motility
MRNSEQNLVLRPGFIMPTPKPSFRSYVNFRLELVSRTARQAADKIYKRKCGLDILHIRILRIVAERPNQAVNYVVRESMLDRTLVSRIVSELVRQGLLKRAISSSDARQILLATTSAGIKRVRKANALGDALNNDLLEVLSEREIEVFNRCLAKLAKWRPKDSNTRLL